MSPIAKTGALVAAVVCVALAAAGGPTPPGPAVPSTAPAQEPAWPVVIYSKDNPPATPKLEELALTDTVSRYGITWKFNEKVRVGRFVNGDYYVVGPATVAEITPKPENGRNQSALNLPVNTAGASPFDDRVPGGRGKDGLKLRAQLPVGMKPGDALISSISVEPHSLRDFLRPADTNPSPVGAAQRRFGSTGGRESAARPVCVAPPGLDGVWGSVPAADAAGYKSFAPNNGAYRGGMEPAPQIPVVRYRKKWLKSTGPDDWVQSPLTRRRMIYPILVPSNPLKVAVHRSTGILPVSRRGPALLASFTGRMPVTLAAKMAVLLFQRAPRALEGIPALSPVCPSPAAPTRAGPASAASGTPGPRRSSAPARRPGIERPSPGR